MLRFVRSVFFSSVVVIGGLALESSAQAGGYGNGPAGVRIDWSGVYLGIHGGGAWSKANSELLEPPALLTLLDAIGIPTASSHDLDGFLAGGHIGLQGQFGQFVLGVEASFTGGKLDGSSSAAFDGVLGFPPVLGATWDGETVNSTNVGEIFTATGRVGYTWDRWLAYVKGGYASGKVSNTSLTGVDVTGCFLGFCAPASGGGSTRSDARHHGWTVGGGFEYMLSPDVTFGVEYNYIDLGAKTHSSVTAVDVGGVGVGSFDSLTRVDVDAIHAVYARLSVKIGADTRRGMYGW